MIGTFVSFDFTFSFHHSSHRIPSPVVWQRQKQQLSAPPQSLVATKAAFDILSPDQLSTPERYAKALNMTVEEMEEQKRRRRKASEDLHRRLQSKELNGKEKHELTCQHLYENARHPFVCKNCWSYQPICVCDLVTANTKNNKSINTAGTTAGSTTRNDPEEDAKNVEVVVWTHHREWGLVSNTGIILSLALPTLDCRCQMLMKGLKEHDQKLQDIIGRPDGNQKSPQENDDTPPLVVVLWPKITKTKRTKKSNKGDEGTMETESAMDFQEPPQKPSKISVDEIKKELTKNPRRKVVLIAIDGTWRNARRMVSRLPSTIPRLDLSTKETFFSSPSNGDTDPREFVSILAPLRSRGDDGHAPSDDGNPTSRKRQVCTAEAVVGALVGIGKLNEDQGNHVLEITKTKIDRVCRYRGKELQ